MPTAGLNIEAFQVVGQILTALRDATQTALLASFGERWYETAISRELFNRLIGRKEREKAVNAYNDEYFRILEYADFSDLQEIYQLHPEVGSFMSGVSPNPQVRQTRMLELHALHDKLAGLRDINDAELTFLKNFQARISNAMGEMEEPAHDRSQWAAGSRPATAPGPAPAPPRPEATQPPVLRPAPQAAGPQPQGGPAPAAPQTTMTPPPAPGVAPPPAARYPAAPPASPPAPAASGVADDAPRQASAALAAAASRRAQSPAAPAAPVAETHVPESVEEVMIALTEENDAAIIEALYREVLVLSESLLAAGGPRRPRVWELVVESPWYQKRFATLGLRPVSDYYDLFQMACEKLKAGASRAQLQEFLQAHSFPKVVLNIGVFFHQRRAKR